MRAPREYTDEQLAAKAAAKEAKESKQAEVNRQQAAVDAVLAEKVKPLSRVQYVCGSTVRSLASHSYATHLLNHLPTGKA